MPGSRGTSAPSLAFLAGAALLFLSSGAGATNAAAVPIPEVVLEGCGGADESAFADSLAFEISVMGQLPADVTEYTLRVRCVGPEVHLSLRDAADNERLRRSVAPHSEAGMWSREVALAAAELLLAWNWIPVSPPTPSATQTPQGVAGHGPPARAVAPVPANPFGVFVAADVALHVRSLSTGAFVHWGPAGAVGWRTSGGAGIAIAGRWMNGRVSRKSGSVVSESSTIAAQGDWLKAWGSGFAAYGSFELGASYVSLVGAPRSSDLAGGRVRGFLPELKVEAGPALRFSKTHVALLGVVGLSPRRLEARVVGDDPVRFDGVFFGIALEALVSLRRRESP